MNAAAWLLGNIYSPACAPRHFSSILLTLLFCASQLTIAVFKIAMESNQFDHGPDLVPLQPNSDERTNASEHVSASSPITWPSQLGVDFQPSKLSVICGRGKSSYDHTGNHHLRMLASAFVADYSQAGRKLAKSSIVAYIVAMTRERGGSFCKCENGAWFEVGDRCAREKVSTFFRDRLHNDYRSSAKAKTALRRARAAEQNETQPQQYVQQLLDVTGHSDDGAGHSDDFSIPSSWSGSSKDSLGFDHSLDVDFFEIDVVFEN
jgi:hypothetical protein